MVSARFHRHGALGALDDQHRLHRRHRTTRQGFIHSRLQGHRLVFAEATIGGNHRFGLPINQAIAQGIGGKATKHHRVGSTNAGAGQHRYGCLRHHGHVEGDQIALANPQRFEGIGSAANLSVELPVAEAAHIARLALPDQSCLLSPGAIEMAIQAVVGEVGGAAFEPTGEGGIAPIEHLLKGLEPMQVFLGLLSPESIGISVGLGHQGAIGLQGANGRLSREGLRWSKDALFLQNRFDLRVRHQRGRAYQRN